MLFFAEACMLLLVPNVESNYMRSILAGWSIRLLAGAVRAFQVCDLYTEDRWAFEISSLSSHFAHLVAATSSQHLSA